MEDEIIQDLFIAYFDAVSHRNFERADKIKIAMNKRKEDIKLAKQEADMKKKASLVASGMQKMASRAYEAIDIGLNNKNVLAYLEDTLEDRREAVDFIHQKDEMDGKAPFQLRQFVVCNAMMEETAEELKPSRDTILAFAAACEETSEFIKQSYLD